MRPIKGTLDGAELYYSEWIESVRKDIECVFGILKARFRFLRNAISYHDSDMIGHAFRAAAILHNMLLRYDGLDIEFGSDLEAAFNRLDPNEYDDKNNSDAFYKGAAEVDVDADLAMLFDHASSSEKTKLVTFANIFDDTNRNELKASIVSKCPRVIETRTTSFDEFQKLMVDNLCFHWHVGELYWPRAQLMKRNNRQVSPALHAAMMKHSPSVDRILLRMEEAIQDSLQSRQSSCLLGSDGVYCDLDILPNSIVATFQGMLVPFANKESYQGKHGVLKEIPIGQPRFSVHFESQSSYTSCIASQVVCMNDVPLRTRMVPNCRLKVDPRNKKAYIVAFTFIPKGTEIITYAMNK
jgi:hypothetical protein